MKYRVSKEELQHLHSWAYLSSCPNGVNIDSIVIRALQDYVDSREDEVEVWKNRKYNSEGL